MYLSYFLFFTVVSCFQVTSSIYLVLSVYFLVLKAYISYLIEVFKSQALSTARQRQFRESRQRRSEQGFTTPASTLQQGRLLAEPRLASCFIWSSDESNAR